MERYKPLARMHGAGGPSSPRGGDADRNVSARQVKGDSAFVAGRRHWFAGVCPTFRFHFLRRASAVSCATTLGIRCCVARASLPALPFARSAGT